MTRPGAVAAIAVTMLVSEQARALTQQSSFRSSTLAVRVDVLVTDGGKPLGGLKAQDFELRDNGVLQTLDVADGADVPINAVLALDTSASTAGKRQDDLVAASETLLAALKPADRAALTVFNHVVGPRIGLTSDFAAVRAALRTIVPAGQTSVMDGAYVALTATLGQPGRSLVLVCTDGFDTWSWLRPEDVVESAKRSNVVLYAVTVEDTRRDTGLKRLADATGGHVLQVKSSRELRDAFQRILEDFRNRYVLAYTPVGVPLDGNHTLDVRVKRRGATVKARPGYIGVSLPR
jgi:Ca-activated chloride channel family protein